MKKSEFNDYQNKSSKEKYDLKSLSVKEIYSFFENLGLPSFRSKQLIHWIYERMVLSVNDITEFPKDLRTKINDMAYISNIKMIKKLVSTDGTTKFLFELEDGLSIESVLIPDDDRLTLCVSSQVGCAVGCKFCLTGKGGFKRNLGAHEIVDQVIAVNRCLKDKKITNIVFMGMGEPLLNLDNVVEALWRITELIGISKRKITVSTSGIVPNILLFQKKAPEVNLAISLNASSDEIRNKIMPINKKYPLETLINTCRKYPLNPGRKLTFEYVMIEGINDSLKDAKELVRILKGIRCNLNLIPYNPFSENTFKRPSDEKILAFQKMLFHKNRRAIIRESRGQDILAACGQLRASN